MEFKKEKFKDVLHYIISKCGIKSNFGKTVIYKLLYFSDFNYFELYEKPLTNESYRKLPHGPAPTHFDIAIDELTNEGKISVETQQAYLDKIMYKYHCLKEPNNRLNSNELDVINNVINTLGYMNVSKICEYCHGDMPCRIAEDYEIMDYAYVFYRDPQYVVRTYNELS